MLGVKFALRVVVPSWEKRDKNMNTTLLKSQETGKGSEVGI
jgi:hypothetical protein